LCWHVFSNEVLKNYKNVIHGFFTIPIKPSVFCFAPSWTQLDWGLEGY